MMIKKCVTIQSTRPELRSLLTRRGRWPAGYLSVSE